MRIEQRLQGKWCLLVEGNSNSIQHRKLIEIRNGLLLDDNGIAGVLAVSGLSVRAQLADNVRVAINLPDDEAEMTLSQSKIGADRLHATVTTSFCDGSHDLVEHALLVRRNK